jgi:hypothetical protein
VAPTIAWRSNEIERGRKGFALAVYTAGRCGPAPAGGEAPHSLLHKDGLKDVDSSRATGSGAFTSDPKDASLASVVTLHLDMADWRNMLADEDHHDALHRAK